MNIIRYLIKFQLLFQNSYIMVKNIQMGRTDFKFFVQNTA